MPLPITSTSLPPDVAAQGWAALTVRVAWTLLSLKVRPKAQVLRDARDHVLFHLEPTTPLARAEDLAAIYTRGFVARARRQVWNDPWPQDMEMPLSPRWRRALDEALRPLAAMVFQQHYGYGRSLDDLERRMRVERLMLDEARGSIREIVRRVGCEDGLPMEGWSPERIDALLTRLAAFSVHESPPLDEVADGCHEEWVNVCPRVDRTVRLVRAGVLHPDDLASPGPSARPADRVRVLAIHFYPDARRHRAAIAKEIGGHTQPVGDDVLLVDAGPDQRAIHILTIAAELGLPAREHLRAVLVEGPGRWSRHGLLGPVPETARARVRSIGWGFVEGQGELPPPLPPAPSPRRWWWAAAASLAVAGLAWAVALRPMPAVADVPVDVEFTEGRGGIWVNFDADELAYISLIKVVDGRLEIVFAGANVADKASFATGDGRYRLHALGSAVLLVSTATPIENLPSLIAEAGAASDPLAELTGALRREHPGADIQRFNRREDR
jgi:hypothetical protein